MVVPQTVACAAPGAVIPNCSRPSGSQVAELVVITGASIMVKGWADVAKRALFVTLVIWIV
jgi:hypothetical protein